MGLDSVELIMAVEKDFGVSFDRLSVPDLRTVGSLWQQVLARSPEHVRSSPEAHWQRFRLVVAKELGVDLSRVTTEARFVEDLGID